MKLEEAIKTLRNSGYIFEDTDTHEDELFDLKHSEDFTKSSKKVNRYNKLKHIQGNLDKKIINARLYNKEGTGRIKTIADLIEYAKSKGFNGKVFDKYSGYINFTDDPDDCLIIDYDSYYADEGGWEVYWSGTTGDGFDTVDEITAYVKSMIKKYSDK